MKCLLKVKEFILFLIITGLVSGCATRSIYQQASNDFAKGLDEANGTLTAILSSTTRDMRLQAIGYYIEYGDREKEVNLDPDDIKSSFARYVCAGYGLHSAAFGNLSTLDAYKAHITALSKEPKEDLSELIGSIKSLDKPQPLLSFAEVKSPSELQKRCLSDVIANVPPGKTLERASTESLTGTIAAIGKVETLVNTLQAAAIDLLQVVDDAKRTKVIRQYVLDNKEIIETNFNELRNSDSFELAWVARKNASLVVPYYRFEYMLTNIDRKNEIEKLLKQEAAVHESLVAYDQLGVLTSPGDIIEKMKTAQENLVRLAEGKLEPGEAWAVFLSFRDSASAVADAIGVATSAVEEFE